MDISPREKMFLELQRLEALEVKKDLICSTDGFGTLPIDGLSSGIETTAHRRCGFDPNHFNTTPSAIDS